MVVAAAAAVPELPYFLKCCSRDGSHISPTIFKSELLLIGLSEVIGIRSLSDTLTVIQSSSWWVVLEMRLAALGIQLPGSFLSSAHSNAVPG